MKKMKKWCVVASGQGWGFYLKPYEGEEDHNPDTEILANFREAKRVCLDYNLTFLGEVKDLIKSIRKQRAKK